MSKLKQIVVNYDLFNSLDETGDLDKDISSLIVDRTRVMTEKIEVENLTFNDLGYIADKDAMFLSVAVGTATVGKEVYTIDLAGGITPTITNKRTKKIYVLKLEGIISLAIRQGINDA